MCENIVLIIFVDCFVQPSKRVIRFVPYSNAEATNSNTPVFQYAFKCKECLLIHHHNAETQLSSSQGYFFLYLPYQGTRTRRASLTSLLILLIVVPESRKTHPLPLSQSRPSETADAAPSGVVSTLRVVEALIVVQLGGETGSHGRVVAFVAFIAVFGVVVGRSGGGGGVVVPAVDCAGS